MKACATQCKTVDTVMEGMVNYAIINQDGARPRIAGFSVPNFDLLKPSTWPIVYWPKVRNMFRKYNQYMSHMDSTYG